MIWTYVLVAITAGCLGYLAAAVRDRHSCVVCFRPLARVCVDARCGGTPGAESVRTIPQETEVDQDAKISTGSILERSHDDGSKIEHPVWCDRRGCAERGHHESAQVRANADQSAERIEHRVTGDGDRGERDEATELLIVRAALRQHIIDGRTLAPVYVELDAYDRPEDEHTGMVLTPLQARLLAAGIRMLLRTAVR